MKLTDILNNIRINYPVILFIGECYFQSLYLNYISSSRNIFLISLVSSGFVMRILYDDISHKKLQRNMSENISHSSSSHFVWH
jgi:hypothetical protein